VSLSYLAQVLGGLMGSVDLPPAALQEEYRFIRLVSSFLQAVVTSSIGIRHSAVLLAHYGRLGDTYDVCVKPLIEVLREEALFQENGALVADIMVQALSEVRTL
jgi:cohesin complex subunit SA-1/2